MQEPVRIQQQILYLDILDEVHLVFVVLLCKCKILIKPAIDVVWLCSHYFSTLTLSCVPAKQNDICELIEAKEVRGLIQIK